MLALARLVIFGAILLGALYLGLSWSLRRKRRAEMEKDWDAAGRPGDRATYIATGMAQYDRSLQRKLVWLVVILPVVALVLIVWLANFK